MKSKKTGVSTNTIINPKLENRLRAKEEKLKKMNTCIKCKNFIKRRVWCKKHNFRISTIELGLICKDFNK